MNKREQILAALVGGLLVVLGGGYVVTLILSSFEQRANTLQSLNDDVRRTKMTVTRGDRAKQRRNELRLRSLPADISLARSVYQTWLIKSAEGAGLREVSVTPSAVGTQRNIYHRHRFTLAARGTLDQTIRFLYAFESAGHLHRIENLLLQPYQDNVRELDVRFTADALSMIDATDQTELTTLPGNRLAHADLSSYIEKIVHRNVYGPANQPPAFSSGLTQTGNPDKPLVFTVKASDPDKSDKITYALGENKLEGIEFDSQSGEIKWTPKELGEFELAVTATDNGYPPKSVTVPLKIRVIEPPVAPPAPPAPKPSYEIAKLSTISAINSVNGRREIWVNIRPEGRIVIVHEGEPLQVGDLKAVVKKIAKDAVEIEFDGSTQRVALGQPLVATEG